MRGGKMWLDRRDADGREIIDAKKRKGILERETRSKKTKLTSKSNLYIHVYIYTYIACSTSPHRQKLN